MDLWVRTLFLMVLVSVATCWTHGLSRKKAYNKIETYPFPWAPARSSDYAGCSRTGQSCLTTSQCCSGVDVCVTTLKYNAIPLDIGQSTCQDVGKQRKYTNVVSHLRSSGQPCSDSSDCIDRCCRLVRGHRARYQSCGTPEDEYTSYTCVQATRTGNDVLDDLL